jgi:tRNA threonylcarbamoyl adenosine modification protein YeaZ
VEELYQKLSPDFSRIDYCLIGKGIGSYNGLRVGYSFLKGLLCPQPCPVVEISSPQTMAFEASQNLKLPTGTVLVVHDARRNELFTSLFTIESGTPSLSEEKFCSPPQLKTMLENLPFDAVVSYEIDPQPFLTSTQLPWISIYPRASRAAELSLHLDPPKNSSLATLEPHYVRSSESTVTQRKAI